jgi:hypothetical protein
MSVEAEREHRRTHQVQQVNSNPLTRPRKPGEAERILCFAKSQPACTCLKRSSAQNPHVDDIPERHCDGSRLRAARRIPNLNRSSALYGRPSAIASSLAVRIFAARCSPPRRRSSCVSSCERDEGPDVDYNEMMERTADEEIRARCARVPSAPLLLKPSLSLPL